MNKMFRLNGELVEVTEEEILAAVEADDKNHPTDLMSQVINSCLMSAYIYGRVHFDTAKDTAQMLAAANETQKVLRELLEYQMRIKLEELVQESLTTSKVKKD